MVWSTAQSALYKAVDDYNSRGINVKNYRENTSENCAENCNNFREKMPEKSRENCSDNSDIFREKLCGNNLKNSDDFADNSGGFSRENCIRNSDNFRRKIPENRFDNSDDFADNFDNLSSKNLSEKSGNFRDKFSQSPNENCSKNPRNFSENSGYFHCENGKKCGKTSETAEKNGCKRLQNDANFTAKDCKNGIFASFASQPFADKDFIILAGLIFILMSEKADSKLILALVFVLLG